MSAIPPNVRKKVAQRSDGMCERWVKLYSGHARCGCRATDMHHLLARSQGGKHTVDNLIHLCYHCHDFCHRFPDKAMKEGLVKLASKCK